MASGDPRSIETREAREQERQDLELRVRTINEVRAERGLVPVPWGDEPYKIPATQVIDTE